MVVSVMGQDTTTTSSTNQKINEASTTDESKRVWGSAARDPNVAAHEDPSQSTTTTHNNNNIHHHHHASEDPRTIGETSSTTATGGSSTATTTGSSSSSSSSTTTGTTTTGTTSSTTTTSSGSSSTTTTTTKIPFIPSKSKTSTPYQDPFSKGFEITARVYTNPSDRLAYFDFETSIHFPFWECGVQGSTTAPIPIQHFIVRHMLGGSKPNSFTTGVGSKFGGGWDWNNNNNDNDDNDNHGSGDNPNNVDGTGGGSDEFGPNPQLLIPLVTVDVVLNSGQSHTFEAGNVVLLENVLMGGHKLIGHDQHDMVALLLTLPHPYRHVGKEKNSLTTMFAKTFWRQSPCKTGLSTTSNGDDVDNNNNANGLAQWVMSAPHRGMRRVGLGIIGAGMSLAIADFVGKTAPFILAVMFGGGSLVVGGTLGAIKLGEFGLDQLELWNEKRLLRLDGNDIVRDGPNPSSSSGGGGGGLDAGSRSSSTTSDTDIPTKTKVSIPESVGIGGERIMEEER